MKKKLLVRSRHPATVRTLLSFLLVYSAATAFPAFATQFLIPSGTTQPTPVTLNPGDSLLVQSNGTLSVAVPATFAVSMDENTSIDNSGLIQMTGTPPSSLTSVIISNATTATPSSILNRSSGTLQFIGTLGLLNPVIDFSNVSANLPLTVNNQGTMTGNLFIGANGLTTFVNSGTINIDTGNHGLGFIGTSTDTHGNGNNVVFMNSGVVNINRAVINAVGNLTLTNTGTIDLVNLGALSAGTAPDLGLIIRSENDFLSLNNSGTIGFQNFVNIISATDLQLVNSGTIGSLINFNTITASLTGFGPNGSNILNTPSGSIITFSSQATPNNIIDFSGVVNPSTIVNQGLLIGNILLGGGGRGATTVTFGGPSSIYEGNITASDTTTNNVINIVDNFSYGGQIVNIATIQVIGGTFNFLATSPLDNSTSSIVGFNTFTVASSATANISAELVGSSSATLTNNGTFNLNFRRITVPLGMTNNGTFTFQTASTVGGTFINNGLTNLNNNVTFMNGSFINNGTLAVTSPVTLTGNYTQNAGATFATTLTSQNNYGSLTINGTSTFSNSNNVLVSLANNNTVTDGNTFDVIISQNALPGASAFLVTSTSPLFSFTASIINGRILRLLANALTYTKGITSPNALVMAQTFDAIRLSNIPGFAQFISILNGKSPSERQFIFDTLYPDPYEGSSFASFAAQESFINKITALTDIKRQASLDLFKKGYMAGDWSDLANDIAEGCPTVSPIYFGNVQHQEERDLIMGYRSYTNGVGLLADTRFSPRWRLGAGAGVSETKVRTGFHSSKKSDITSYQGVLTASYEDCECRGFMDGVVTLGYNHYRDRKLIYFGPINLAARAKHNGLQWGGKFRAGYGFLYCSQFEFAPIITYYYARLNRHGYREHGAGVLDTFFPAKKLDKSQVGGGLRIAYLGAIDWIVPEAHAFYLRDLKTTSLRTTGEFTGGGPSFTTFAPNPFKNSVNLGASLTAMVCQDIMLTGAYDLEAQRKFQSHSGTLKLRWLW